LCPAELKAKRKKYGHCSCCYVNFIKNRKSEPEILIDITNSHKMKGGNYGEHISKGLYEVNFGGCYFDAKM
jgi:hypothetical protein